MAVDGRSTEGESTEGESTEGESTEAKSTEVKSTEAKSTEGHQGFVLGTAFSSDDARLYSASIEGDVCVWTVEKGSLSARWHCHDGPILDLEVRGEVFTAGLDGTVGVWDATTGSLRHSLAGHTAGIHGVAVCDSLIATASADGRIGLWDRAGNLIRYLSGHEETVTSVVFVDEATLVSGSRDRTLRIWDLADGRERQVLKGHDWWVTKVALTANRNVLSASEDCTLRLWEVDAGAEIWAFEDCPGPIWGLAVHPRGDRAAFGYGGEVIELDLESRATEQLPDDAPVSGRTFSYSGDGNKLAIGHDHGEVQVLDRNQPALVARFEASGRQIISGVARPDLTVTGHIGGEVESTVDDRSRRHSGHGFFVYSSRFVGGSRFATGAFDGKVKIWETGTESPVAEHDHGGLVFSLAVAGDGKRLLAAGWDRLSLWDLETGEPIWRLVNAGVGHHLVAAFCAEQGLVAGVGEAPNLKIWQVGSESESRTEQAQSWRLPDAHNCAIEALPGGHQAIVGSAYGRVSLVDLADGSSRALHGEHEDWIRIVRVAPDAVRVATVSQNGTARVYDLGIGKVVERFAHQPVALVDFDDAGALRWIDCRGNRYGE